MKLISVIGSSQVKRDSDEYRFAYELGKLIAKNGFGVVCGGREGIMEAVCRGAKEENGITIGIMPSIDGSDANRHVDIKINTGLGHARNPIVVASGEVVVAISGNYGTLSEIAYSKIFGKTVLGYKTHKVDGVIQIFRPDEVFEYIK
ncbi:TIGR00725 family protein [Persephonella sp.]